MTRSTLILAAAFVLFWNSGFIAAEFALPGALTFTLMFWRYGLLCVVLGGVLLFRGCLVWPGFRRAGISMGIGILSHGVWLSCVLLAFERGVPAGIVALVVALQPLVTGALSGWMTGERTPMQRWIGLGLGFAGVCVVLLNRIQFSDAASIFGYLIPLVSVLAITVASLFQRRLELQEPKTLLPADLSLFYQGLGTVLVMVVPAMWREGFSTDWSGEFVLSLLWLVLAVSLGAYGLMWRLITQMDATRVASLFYLGPPVTMLMAWFAFGDRLRVTDVVGLVVVLAGIIMTYLRKADGEGAFPS